MSKPIITEHRAADSTPGRLVTRIGWFVAIWAASIVVVAGVAEGLKRLILG